MGCMPLGERERRWLEAMQKVSQETALESGWGTPEDRQWVTDWANERRARKGIPPLGPDTDYPPELEFYERARTLGLLRSRSIDA